MMETPANSPKPGRFIRAALVIFPAGTIVLGIASFGIWHWKRTQVEARSYRHAAALRRDMSPAVMHRYASILRDVMRQPPASRLPAVASYLESSMGAENMGYEVRRDSFLANGVEVSAVDAELTGKKRPREVVLLLVPYGVNAADAATVEQEVQALAGMMSLAHAVTGENRTLTLRFAAAPLYAKDGEGRSALDRLAAAARDREERFMQILVAAGPDAAVLAEVRRAFRIDSTGTIVRSLPATADVAATLTASLALKNTLMQSVER